MEKNKSGKHQTRHICKPGPTVLITTGIKSPGQQLGTRILEVGISDDPEQTWAILERQALEDSGQAPPPPDVQPWIDLQRWLVLQPARVHIPFDKELLQALKARLKRPPTRLRRDFKQLNTCIAAIALLYQCQRTLAPGGAVLATLDDYEEARVLLEPVFATITTEGVTKAIRETVDQVGPDEELSISELARRLGLSKTATYARVERALGGGWLINREEREGKRYPAKLVRGANLPENRPVLPTKDELQPRPPPTDPETTSTGVEQDVNNGATENMDDGPATVQPDCSTGTGVEQLVEQQINNASPTENDNCSTVLLNTRLTPPSPLTTKTELCIQTPPTNSPAPSTGVEQDVNNSAAEEMDDRPSTGQQDCSSATTVEQSIEQQINNATPTENDNCSTVLVATRLTPPSPLPSEGDALEQSSMSPADVPSKTQPKRKKAPVVEIGPTYDAGSFLYIKEATELEKVLPSLLDAPELAIDTETTGLSHIRDRIRLVQLATLEQVVLVDVFHIPLEMLSPIMRGDRTLYVHNAKFDVKMLTHAGLPYPTCRIRDAMLLAQILGADDQPSRKDRYTLNTLAKTHLEEILDKRWQKGPWDGDLCEEQLRYAAVDAKILFPLITKLLPEVPKANLEKIVDLEHRCLLPLLWLEHAGMGVDAVAWRGLAEKIIERKPILEDELTQLTMEYVQERKEKRRGEPINWNSPQQVLAALHARGIQVDTTATKVLQAFSNDPVVERFLEWVPLAKRSSSFGEKWVNDYFDADTGRVYPSFQQLGSRSGRMSCREPNLQQIPKDLDYRGCFRAAGGYRLVGGDYSQIELRIMAFLTKEPALLDAFARDVDVHKQTAAQLFNVPYDTVTPEQRAQAKTINFGVIYGMGPRGLAARTGYTEPEAQAFWDRYFTTYKKIKQFKFEQLTRARQSGEVRTILGRRRLLPRIHEREAKDWYQVRNMTINTPIQGSAADAFKLAFIRLFEHRDEVPGVRLTNLIHDEIVCETPVDQVELTKAWLDRHMVDAMREMVQDGVPIKVDLKEGPSWAE